MENQLTGNFLIDTGMQEQVATPVSWYMKSLPTSPTDMKIKELANTPRIETPIIVTQENFYWDMMKVIEKEWVDDTQAFDMVKGYYDQKGYTIEWIEEPKIEKENKTVISRVEEKARELAETEWELDLSNKNMFQRLMWETRLKAQAFSDVVEIALW